MVLWNFIERIAIICGDLYNFCINLLFSEINLFGYEFIVLDIIGFLATTGLVIYLTITIINYFTG